MNIAHLEVDYDLVAKTCVCKGRKKKVTFSFVDSAHSLRIKTTFVPTGLSKVVKIHEMEMTGSFSKMK